MTPPARPRAAQRTQSARERSGSGYSKRTLRPSVGDQPASRSWSSIRVREKASLLLVAARNTAYRDPVNPSVAPATGPQRPPGVRKTGRGMAILARAAPIPGALGRVGTSTDGSDDSPAARPGGRSCFRPVALDLMLPHPGRLADPVGDGKLRQRLADIIVQDRGP